MITRNDKERLNSRLFLFSLSILFLIPMIGGAFAAETAGAHGKTLDLTNHWVGYMAIVVFVLSYCLVMLERSDPFT